MAKKEVHVVDENGPKDKEINLGEIGEKEPIEKVTETDFVKAADLEAFMNEPVTIMVHESYEEGSLDVIVPNVNGMNQPILRGREQVVKRKYVEALARARTTIIRQAGADFNSPDEPIKTHEKTVLTYPFTVIKDTPRGFAWIKAIQEQP